MKVAIVGAGVSGLAGIRYALQYNIECVAYEITENVGGSWVYYEKVENELKDELVPTAMYYNLRTLLPDVLMEFRGYRFKPKSGRRFPDRSEVLKYIESFAKDNNLMPHIKFSHKVMNISQRNEKWTVKVKNLKTDEETQQEFDAVMVCSGRCSIPNHPNYPGMNTFPHHNIHSCYYRRNDRYENQVVLVVGKGPSALDISRQISQVATKVILSHRGKTLNFQQKNIIQKPDIDLIDNDRVYFEDNTSEKVNAIIYCTGYRYEYPFLDSSCEITHDGSAVSPLYKHFINAKHPTMCIIGLVQKTIIFQKLDLQAEVFIKIIAGYAKLPSKDEMLSEVQNYYNEKRKLKVTGSHFYHLTEKNRYYLDELCELGNCEPFAPVLFDIFDKNTYTLLNDYDNLRNQIFDIIDDHTYVLRWKMENGQSLM